MNIRSLINLDARYIRNIGWQSAGNASAQVINIASMPIITRLFSPADLGVLSLFMQAIALTTILTSFRVEHVVMLPRTDTKAKHLAAFVCSMGLMSCAVLSVIAILLGALDLIPDQYKIWVVLLPVTSLFFVVSQAFQQLSQRTGYFRTSGLSEIANRLSNSLVAIAAGFAGLPGIMLGVSVGVGFFFKTALFSLFFGILSPNLIRSVRLGLRVILRQGLTRLLGSLIVSHSLLAVTSLLPLAYITYRYGEGFAGHFSLVLSTVALPTTLLGKAIGQVFYQRAAQTFADGATFSGLVIENAKLLTLIAVPCFSTVIFFGPFLYPFVFGAEWGIAGQVSQVYAFAAALSFMTVPFDRSGLIVNAWWYGASWHLARLVTTALVIFIVDRMQGDFFMFIYCLTLQASVLYVIDGSASYLFSRRSTPFPAKLGRRRDA